jgi:ankyrin repeat protein
MAGLVKRGMRGGLAMLGAAALIMPGIAAAQFQSPTSVFLKAVRESDGAKVQEVLSAPGTTILDSRDSGTGQAALHIVVARRDLTWLSFLLGKGARPDIKDKDGTTPLMIAAQLGFTEGADMLMRSRARVDEPNNQGETPLIRAVQHRDLRMIKLLLEAGANPDRADTLAGLSARDYAKRDSRNGAVLRAIEDTAKKPKPSAIGPN